MDAADGGKSCGGGRGRGLRLVGERRAAAAADGGKTRRREDGISETRDGVNVQLRFKTEKPPFYGASFGKSREQQWENPDLGQAQTNQGGSSSRVLQISSTLPVLHCSKTHPPLILNGTSRRRLQRFVTGLIRGSTARMRRKKETAKNRWLERSSEVTMDIEEEEREIGMKMLKYYEREREIIK